MAVDTWLSVRTFLEVVHLTMADLEAVLADVSYLMAMEKSKCTPAARNELEDID